MSSLSRLKAHGRSVLMIFAVLRMFAKMLMEFCFLKKFNYTVAVSKICCFLFLKFAKSHCRLCNYVEEMKNKAASSSIV